MDSGNSSKSDRHDSTIPSDSHMSISEESNDNESAAAVEINPGQSKSISGTKAVSPAVDLADDIDAGNHETNELSYNGNENGSIKSNIKSNGDNNGDDKNDTVTADNEDSISEKELESTITGGNENVDIFPIFASRKRKNANRSPQNSEISQKFSGEISDPSSISESDLSRQDSSLARSKAAQASKVRRRNGAESVSNNKTKEGSDNGLQEEKKVSDETPPTRSPRTPDKKTSIDAAPKISSNLPECDAAFRSLVNLDPIPETDALPKLTPLQFAQLEAALQIGDKFSAFSEHHTWREDWNGNLQLFDKELIMNKEDVVKNPGAKKVTMQFCDWVAKLARHSDDFTAIEYLFSFIYNIKGTPPMAKEILAYSLNRPASSVAERLQFITNASRRISYDPTVLNQDGWTTVKADAPIGHTGGSYLIGRRVFWHSYEAIVIAFVRDEDLGDLWKCIWIEDHDTFDLEADELMEGMKKWEKKILKRKVKAPGAPMTKQRPPSIRFEANRNFTVSGIEDGIILAKSYKSKSGRPWPARVMHVTELKALGTQVGSRRSSSRNEIHVVFLAPFWNGETNGTSVPTATSMYATGPLFELETIDVSSETIEKYPYARTDDPFLSITDLQSEFNFLGLPKAAFPRFLDAHRMASALKVHASKENRKKKHNSIDADATASLTDTHPLSIKTFSFPDALLNLPFGYILSKYPELSNRSSNRATDLKEPIMQLQVMLDSLVPPNCWGPNADASSSSISTPLKQTHELQTVHASRGLTPTLSPALNASLRVRNDDDGNFNLWDIESFASDYLLKHIKPSSDGKVSDLQLLYDNLEKLVQVLNKTVIDLEEGSTSNLEKRQEMLGSIIVQCLTAKGHCEDFLFSIDLPVSFNKRNIIIEWRKTCERIYKRAIVRLGHVDYGNGVMAVLTDSRCNAHITATGSFERAVRLPAAIKGAKKAGVGSRPSLPLVTYIEDTYLAMAEEKILPMAHTTSYLKRIKTKITNLTPDAKGVPLTDGSDGEGGEDTSE